MSPTPSAPRLYSGRSHCVVNLHLLRQTGVPILQADTRGHQGKCVSADCHFQHGPFGGACSVAFQHISKMATFRGCAYGCDRKVGFNVLQGVVLIDPSVDVLMAVIEKVGLNLLQGVSLIHSFCGCAYGCDTVERWVSMYCRVLA